jgi:hypothetical protein
MTLANMRVQGVRSLSVTCWLCHHGAVQTADRWRDEVPLPSLGPRMVCTGCGNVGADVRPNWAERAQRESLTGAQWADDLGSHLGILPGMGARHHDYLRREPIAFSVHRERCSLARVGEGEPSKGSVTCRV